MIKHIIIWNLKDGIDKDSVKAEIKKQLEGLVGKIEGLLEMNIITSGLPSSTGDLMMDSTFENKEALDLYQSHPLHKEIANGLVRPSMQERLSFDFEV